VGNTLKPYTAPAINGKYPSMTKLLNKPLKAFILFTFLVLSASIPVYFYFIESIWMDELDDHNRQVKEQIRTGFNASHSVLLNEKIALWNAMQSSSRIEPVSGFRRDSVYVVEREMMESGPMEEERFRGLTSTVVLGGKPYLVTVETNVEEIHETVLEIALITGLFILLLIAGFILLNRRLSARVWLPFTDALEKLKRFNLDSNESVVFKETDVEEFTELNAVLTQLIENTRQSYRQQKEFTQNASHELQTPLALLKSKLDLLIQDRSLNTSQRQVIESLDNSISRISRINKNLLLLAGIENRGYESGTLDLSGIVRNLFDVFSESASSLGIGLSAAITEEEIIDANESLLEIMISNLLSNAVRHCSPKSDIRVILNDRVLVIDNEGGASLDAANLFRRFTSAGTGNPGTGLGLAIVKEICDKYGWQVAYVFAGGRHVFSVSFSS